MVLTLTQEAFKKIIDWQPDFSIIAGDFNISLVPIKDTKNYLHINNPNARIALKDQMEQNSLVDIWRDTHPNENVFTWHKYNENKQRLLWHTKSTCGSKHVFGRGGLLKTPASGF